MIEVHQADCLEWMRSQPAGRFDLVFGSPPYEKRRRYGELNFNLEGQAWVDWMVEVVVESLRVCRGLVAYVVQGGTKKFRWSVTPALLMADLHRRGISLRNPPIFHRVGIPGSGGPDWLRSDYEWIVCATNGGKLPWSEPSAFGKPCRYKPGGAMSYRRNDGQRRNAATGRRLGAKVERFMENGPAFAGAKLHTKRESDGTMRIQAYTPPERANPGTVIRQTVGGGRMGHDLAHDNEAPFPLGLAEFFIRSFCPPNGVALDPFAGSGTTLHAALLHGRRAVGLDIRQSQVDITNRRLQDVAEKIQKKSA